MVGPQTKIKRGHVARSLGSAKYVEMNGADRLAFPEGPNIQPFPDRRINYVLQQVEFFASRKFVYKPSIA